MKPLLALLLASAAIAQSTSSHSGWSFNDTLQTATDVFVGDIVSGSATDDGAHVSVQARLHIVRVLTGSMAAGIEVPMVWQYRPALFEGPEVTSKVPLIRGLWFLHKDSDKLKPLQASAMVTSLGGYYLPAGGNPGYYAENAPLQYKIACEIAPVLEELTTRNAADFAPHPPTPPTRGVLAPWVATRMRYQTLAMALQTLDKKATAGIYRDFSALPDPNLKMLGIQGRLDAGDTSAVFDLEKNLAVLAGAASSGVNMPLTAMGLDFRNDLPAAHAFARIALSDTTLPGLEGGLPFQLAGTRNPEFLPYLVVMLSSPAPGTRDAAIMAFCQLLGPMGDVKASGLWKPEMFEYCPDHSPLNDDPIEAKDIRFWKQWWEQHHDEIAKTVTLPVIVAPARYSAPGNTAWQTATEIPMEIRFQSLLSMFGRQSEHYHDAAGSIVQGASPAPDPIRAQLTPQDQESYSAIINQTNARLAAVQKSSEDMLNAARIAGTFPDIERSKQLNQQREAALKTGLSDLRSRLSPGGWQVIEGFMMRMGISVGRMTTPGK